MDSIFAHLDKITRIMIWRLKHMIQSLTKVYGYKLKSTGEFIPFDDDAELTKHNDGTISIRFKEVD